MMIDLLTRLQQVFEQEDIFKPATSGKDLQDRIEYWMKSNKVVRNPDGTYSSIGDVKVPKFLVKDGRFQIKFKRVDGDFWCNGLDLKTLEGSPECVGGDFVCYENQLTSLQGAPEKVGGSLYCYANRLTSLKGSPKHVGWNFECRGNLLTSLQGSPKYVGGSFDCSWNKLTSLQGSPEYVGGDFVCMDNLRQFTEEEVRKLCKVKGEVIV